jgi:hypothetical protein
MAATTVARPPPTADAPEPSPTRRIIERIWRDRTLAVATAVAIAAAYGVVAGLWTLRGPLTRFEGFTTILLGRVVGAGAGFVLRSRWALLIAPASFALSLELTRLGLTGPTVDAPRFTAYGLIALAVGRGIHG